MAQRFVLGDVHGRYHALKQVLEKSNFDYEKDKLIFLGDIVDGPRPLIKESVEEMTKIKNLIFVIGNHDQWFFDYIKTGAAPWIWTTQGGNQTLWSYHWNDIPEHHKKLFEKGAYFYIEDNCVFVHGGFRYNGSPNQETNETLTWDRKLIYDVKNNGPTANYKHVFVGHTTTQLFGKTEPVTFYNLTMMDCGGGWDGRLALMNLDTKEVFLSKMMEVE